MTATIAELVQLGRGLIERPATVLDREVRIGDRYYGAMARMWIYSAMYEMALADDARAGGCGFGDEASKLEDVAAAAKMAWEMFIERQPVAAE